MNEIEMDAWTLALKITEMPVTAKIQCYHEYSMKEILTKYTYGEAAVIYADYERKLSE